MGRPSCDGFVESLSGHLVLCTGTTHVAGERIFRTRLQRAIELRGARTLSGSRNARVTLLVVGELPVIVADPIHDRTQNLRYAEEQRAKGNHMCIVDGAGISALLRGDPAPCLRSRAVEHGRAVELTLPQPPTRVVPELVALHVGESAEHGPTSVDLDFTGLDRGTRGHQATLASLIEALSPSPTLRLTSPRVDAAWRSTTEPGVLVIAEVKSLTDEGQAHQIRLGIGQLSDYAVSIRRNPPPGITEVRCVLVLEKEPDKSDHWSEVANSAGIDLAWAPDLDGVPR